jgi:hypothetical protein
MSLKLGKLPPKHSAKTLSFAKYAANVLPDPAAKVYREYKTPQAARQMLGNDQYGDCTCAAAANLEILWSCHTGVCVVPSTQEALALYSAVTGFNPSDPNTDQGAAMTDVLNYWQTSGFSIGGILHRILGWAAIDFTNPLHRHLGVQLFGATYVGVNLPSSAMDQFNAGQPWEVVPNAPIEGGHAIIHPGYGALGGDYVTWANWEQKASAAWEAAYIEEEYVIITQDWLDAVTRKTPGGLDLATLQADLNSLEAA